MATNPSLTRETVRSVARNTTDHETTAGPVCHAYLDTENIFLGGASYSAWRRGMAPCPRVAAGKRIFDPDFRLNFTWLRQFAVGEDPDGTARTICVGSTKAGSDSSVFRAYEHSRWQTRVPLRAMSGGEKENETTIAVEMFDDLLCNPARRGALDVTLFSGDRDLRPVVERLGQRGIAVDVVAWEHTVSSALRRLARRFIALDPYFDFLSLRSARA